MKEAASKMKRNGSAQRMHAQLSHRHFDAAPQQLNLALNRQRHTHATTDAK